MTDDAKMAGWVKAYKDKFGVDPDDYAVTAYDAATVIIAALKQVTAGGKVPTRDAMRDAIQAANVNTLQGPVSFDANGDLMDKTISVFQIHQNKDVPAEDMRQYHYIEDSTVHLSTPDDLRRSAAAADHQRVEPRRDVLVARAGLHSGLRHTRTH